MNRISEHNPEVEIESVMTDLGYRHSEFGVWVPRYPAMHPDALCYTNKQAAELAGRIIHREEMKV